MLSQRVVKSEICSKKKTGYFRFHHTARGGNSTGTTSKDLFEDGHKLIQVKEKSRIRYKINNEFIPPRIIRQLEMRGLVKLGAVTDV